MTRKFRPVDVAREFDRSVAWLYMLERRGIIPPPARDPLNGRRIYSPEAVEHIREILLARTGSKV